MLRKLIQQQFPDFGPIGLLPKVPNTFTPTFMKAAANDAEIDGMVDKANEYILEKIQENEDLNELQLDETWEKGIKTGHSQGFNAGIDAAFTPGYNKGLVKGLLAGWEDAETFKAQHRVYDLNKPSIKPIAIGKTPYELSKGLPERDNEL